MRAIGIAIPFIRRRSGAAIDAQAQAHFDRVIADGGLVPSGLSGVNAFFTTIKTIYATSDITTAISVGLDAQVLGYKLGAGAGTTLGQAAQKLYSCSGASGDVVQTTAASQPLLLVHEGANYYQGVGVNGNFVQTASTTFPTNSGYRAVARVKIEGTAARVILAKDSGSGAGRCFTLQYNGSTFSCQFGNGFANNAICTTPIAVGFDKWVKVTADSVGSDMVVKFFESNDNITYSQLGLDVVVAGQANSIQVNNSPFFAGSSNAGFNPFFGKIYRAQAFDVNDNLLADFNPNQYNAANSQTQWTSSTGEVWSVQTGTATSGYKGALVTKTIIQGDGVDDLLLGGNINPDTDKLTLYTAFRRLNNNAGVIFNLGSIANRVLNFVNTSVISGSSVNSGINNEFTIPNNTSFLLMSNNIDRSQVAINEQTMFINNFVQSKTVVVGGDTSGNLANNPLALLARVDAIAPFNGISSTTIATKVLSDTTQLTSMYNYIRSINGNSF